MIILPSKELFLRVIENETKLKNTQINIAKDYKSLFEEYEMIDIRDLYEIIVGGHIPKITKYDNLDLQNIKPLNRDAILLFSIKPDCHLPKLEKICEKISNDYDFDIPFGTKFSDKEELIVIS